MKLLLISIGGVLVVFELLVLLAVLYGAKKTPPVFEPSDLPEVAQEEPEDAHELIS